MVTPTVESVRYTQDNVSVVATRRPEGTGVEGGDDAWSFNLQSIVAVTGAIYYPMPYAEKIVYGEVERDRVGEELVTVVAAYYAGVNAAQDELNEALKSYFPEPATPATPVATSPGVTTLSTPAS